MRRQLVERLGEAPCLLADERLPPAAAVVEQQPAGP